MRTPSFFEWYLIKKIPEFAEYFFLNADTRLEVV